MNLKALNRERGAVEDERAAKYSYKDARDLVVLATGNAYLQALSGAARVETAEAQVKNAQALYEKAVDQQNAGLSPAIDTLRARVEMQNRQQQLITSRNDYAKQKLALIRAIGLPVGQEISLASKAPYALLRRWNRSEPGSGPTPRVRITWRRFSRCERPNTSQGRVRRTLSHP